MYDLPVFKTPEVLHAHSMESPFCGNGNSRMSGFLAGRVGRVR